MTTTIDRRKFLAAGGVTAVTAAGAGVTGELLLGQRFRRNPQAPCPRARSRPLSS